MEKDLSVNQFEKIILILEGFLIVVKSSGIEDRIAKILRIAIKKVLFFL